MNIKSRKDAPRIKGWRNARVFPRAGSDTQVTHKYRINTQRAGGYKYAYDAGQIA